VKTVWKFPLTATERFAIAMPRGAQLLHVGTQGVGLEAQASVWVLCDTEAPRTRRAFAVCGTGHDSGHCTGQHIGTFMLGNGALVFHVFDLGEAPEES